MKVSAFTESRNNMNFEHLLNNIPDYKVFLTVDEMDNVNEVGKLMFEKRIKRVFVTRRGSLSGVISRSAFIRLLFSDEKKKKK